MTPNQTVAFHTLGCKLNFSETSSISRQFENAGFAKVSFDEKADVYIINTCSVTDQADKKCKHLVRKVHRTNPSAKIVVTGCFAQLKPDEIISIEGVNLVIGANEKFNILEHLEKIDIDHNKQVVRDDIMKTKTFYPSYSAGDRTRSFLKVQDGCDYFCSFCTIPLARGTSRNASIEETVRVAKEVAKKGVQEIVLTGVNIGDFGKSTKENFIDLIKELDKIEAIKRFRISSIEPNLLSQEIIAFVAQSERFVPHFHIPLQSGSNKILKLMRRRYERELYAERIDSIKTQMPDCCIGVDVIVGFPGETEEDFKETVDFLTSLNISYLHVFPYSEREDTTAVRMTDVVPNEVRQQRCKELIKLSNEKKRAFYKTYTGQTRPVLFESESDDGFISGFTDNYIKVTVPFQENRINTIEPAVLEGFDGMEMAFVRK